jgi:hypothetical protein
MKEMGLQTTRKDPHEGNGLTNDEERPTWRKRAYKRRGKTHMKEMGLQTTSKDPHEGNGLTNDEERPTCKPMYDSHVRYNN